jgi:Raf kinase inhibitor-like YbhB/YbcL family protein
MSIRLVSMAFTEGGIIPRRHSCEGENVSPPLTWTDLPDGACSLAVLCEDPDAPAGIFTHWILYNLPTAASELPEGVPAQRELDNGAHQGMNSTHSIGYSGPCPPHGQSHRYIFRLFALDTRLDLQGTTDRDRLLQAMQGHILDDGQLLGYFAR